MTDWQDLEKRLEKARAELTAIEGPVMNLTDKVTCLDQELSLKKEQKKNKTSLYQKLMYGHGVFCSKESVLLFMERRLVLTPSQCLQQEPALTDKKIYIYFGQAKLFAVGALVISKSAPVALLNAHNMIPPQVFKFCEICREPLAPLDTKILSKEAASTHVKHLITNQEKALRNIESELKGLRGEERRIQAELNKVHKVIKRVDFHPYQDPAFLAQSGSGVKEKELFLPFFSYRN
jgi:septal ring factor EnvC (AmiA/AmiB activator)